VWLERYSDLLPDDPFLLVVPHAIVRLKSPTMRGMPKILQETATQLSHPAPVLETLSISSHLDCSPQSGYMITTALFGGDLSSLRELTLLRVRTELPWRNMVNLTLFTLGYAWPGTKFSPRHLLNFFESAPRLRKIRLCYATPTFDAERGRLVSLPRLERMRILGGRPPHLLLDHLLIPVDAKLTALVDSLDSIHLPRSFDCRRVPSKFRIHLHVRGFYPSIRFGGFSWETRMVPATPQATATCKALESLKVERLRIAGGDLMLHPGSDIYQVLFPIGNLRTLTISGCKYLSSFVHFLEISGLCHELEECVLDPRGDKEKFDIRNAIGLAVARRTRLKSVRIVMQDGFALAHVSKLGEYVPHVECSPGVASAIDAVDSSDEED